MTTINISNKSNKPWYKEPWPWILMSGPLAVVVASFVSAWVALSTTDGLVVEDYYKKGLAANETIAMSDKAKALGLQVGINLTSHSISARLTATDASYVMPRSIRVTLAHPTRAGMDQTLNLEKVGDLFQGEYRLPTAGHWIVTVEDETGSWRLLGNAVLPASGVTIIGGTTAPADIRNQQ